MPRRATLAPHLVPEELFARYRHAEHPIERSHWQIIWLVADGHPVPEVAHLVGYNPNWVRTLIRRYNTEGPAGLVDRRRHNPGQPPLLPAVQRAALVDALAGPAPDGGVWTGPKVAAWMADRLGRPIHPQRGWEALRSLGLTLQRPRPRATTADPVAQAAFKKGGSAPNSRPSTPRIPTQS
jgi:transposase